MFLRVKRIGSTIAVLLGGLIFVCGQGKPVYSDLHDFGRTVTNANGSSGPDGINPSMSAVTFDSAGNMYGTCLKGGPNQLPSTLYPGMVWEITKDGTYFDLHDFGGTVTNSDGSQGPDGTFPSSAVAIDADGNLYGTTQQGGPHDWGIVWRISKTGTYTDLHDFGGTVTIADGSIGADGMNPQGGCAVDSFGNLAGVARSGAPAGNGMIWAIAKTGKYSDLHDFGGTIVDASGSPSLDGRIPIGGVVFDAVGAIYGTAYLGGRYDRGIIWKYSTSGAYSDLHDFGGTVTNANGTQGPDGKDPINVMTFDTAGNLFGTATDSGPGNGGVLWELTKNGTYLDLHDFGATITYSNGTTGPDGYWPYGAVAVDGAGNVYGTTAEGGPSNTNVGILWEVTAAGKYIDLHDFGTTVTLPGGSLGTDGTWPFTGVTVDSSGAIYGAAGTGGGTNGGLIWRLGTAPVSLQGVSISPTSVQGGGAATGTVTLTGVAPTGGVAVALASSDPSASIPVAITVNAGSASAAFAIGTTGVATQTTVTISATAGGTTKSATLTIVAPTVQSLSVNPASIGGGGGGDATATITLTGFAGPNGTGVSLSSSSSAATVPATAIVAAGQNSGTFTITTSAVGTSTGAVITASVNGSSQTTTLTIAPATLAQLSLTPSSVAGGNPSMGTVTLSGKAFTGGLTVSLSSSDKTVVVPTSMTIAAGKSEASFQVATKVVAAQKSVTISATSGSITRSAALSVVLPTLASISVTPTAMPGGQSAMGTVTLNGPAPLVGTTVKLTSSSKSAIVPASVKVVSGKTSATFTIKSAAVPVQAIATLTGSCGAVSLTANLTVNPPRLKAITLTPSSVKGGKSSVATVTIASVAPTGGCLISLSSSTSSATVPVSISIPAGKTNATFTVKTKIVGAKTNATITASYGGESVVAGLIIT